MYNWEQIPPIPVQRTPRKQGRRSCGPGRGNHACKAKCTKPFNRRPAGLKDLPGELGRTYKSMFRRDANGELVLNRRISQHEHFVMFRTEAGRQRGFRSEYLPLIDEVGPMLLSLADLTDYTIEWDFTQLAGLLSEKDSSGNVIKETEVTVARISRLLHMLAAYGVINLGLLNFHYDSKTRLPRYIMLTPKFYELCGANMARIEKMHQDKINDAELRADFIKRGIIQADETISLRAAQKRHQEKLLGEALKRRREKSAAKKRHRRLAGIKDISVRRHAVAGWIEHRIKRGSLPAMTVDQKLSLLKSELEATTIMEFYKPPLEIPPDELPF